MIAASSTSPTASDRRHALRQRDAILEAVAFAAERLLTAAEWEHSIGEVMRQLGAATGMSRVYVVPVVTTGADARRASKYEWTADGVSPRAEAPSGALVPRIARAEPVGADSALGRHHRRSPAEFPGRRAGTGWPTLGVLALVVVPIFVGETWWGFIGFDDCVEERIWPSATVEALRTAAGTLGAAIARRLADEERLQLVREQSARVEAEAAQRRMAFLADASQALAASLDYERTLQAVAELVVPRFADCCFVDIRDGRRAVAAGCELGGESCAG